MLFTQHTDRLTASINGIQSHIDELENQLKALRNDKSGLESELQTVLTLEGAAESAINQAQSFLNAADSMGRTDLIATFWDAMDAMKGYAIAQLPESPEPITTPEPEPINPIEPDTNPAQTDTITVEATEPDTIPDTNPIETDTNHQNGKQPLSVGSAAFDPSQASLDDLKRYVRSYQDDDKTRHFGTLTRRTTWETAAKKLLNS
ncbi:MAG: hypothetical protein I4E98_15320 [Planktothrix agardhii KL2]|jgi:hypothetical protein|uniref:hypothetical protein n=1 Tax=Planktothrix agardhii TaxID=1160 RepID=UPI001A251D73|nr:hypothetical protein [Planktothrix agardhii]MBG0747937.1 hypothetical protein [Planktothrix agardhii KL2]